MVVNDKIDYYLHIFYALVTYLTFSLFFGISKLCSSSASFFKSSKIFRIYLLKKYLLISGPTQFKL